MNEPTVNETITEVVLSYADQEWLAEAACADWPIDAFFVEAGRAIEFEALQLCRRCPVRISCLTHAYSRGLTAGYFGGISPGQRRQMTLASALQHIERDPYIVQPTEDEPVSDADTSDVDDGATEGV